MPSLDTGRYTITNARFSNLAILPDANDDSDIVANFDENNANEKWNITLLNNGRFSIKNHGFNRSAGCEFRPVQGSIIRGQENNKQWVIKEARVKGRYTISPTDAELFWGLNDGEVGTPIALASIPTDTKNQWIITKASF